jgi:ATP-dependent Clp protease ATP-binding subunit ClpB
MESSVLGALQAHFKPEFLNRIDDVIIYHQLDRSQIGTICKIQIERVQQLLSERRITLEVSTEAMDLIADRGYDPQYGARPLKRTIQSMIQDPLAIEILEGRYPEGSTVKVDLNPEGDGLQFGLG